MEYSFLDFRKAFDAVSHGIPREKVRSYGTNRALHDWIFDYLAGRSHYTEVNGPISSGQTVKYGVPQGSLLGPCLFKMYVNDLPSCTKEGNLQMFANDTTAYVIGENIEEVINGLNRIAADLPTGSPGS